MRVLRKISAVILIAALIFSCSVTAAAADSADLSADILYTLGLVRGSDTGYDANRQMTRTDAAVMAVRLSGGEARAQSENRQCPFEDVPAWAEPYIGYAYDTGIVKGRDTKTFGAQEYITSDEYVTLLLRILGYDDAKGDFFWGTATIFGNRLGICRGSYGSFTRGDMFEITLACLSRRTQAGKGETLMAKLISDGTVERAKANAVGLGDRISLTARQVADRCSAAVFYLERYDCEEDLRSGVFSGYSSGFVISPDGIAVTNYHSVAGGEYAKVTFLSGEQYDVESVLYYDVGNDIAVLRVSNLSKTGNRTAAFPYLEIQRSDTVYDGDPVYAIGCPLGLQRNISSGIVSNSARVTDGFSGTVIQNTAAISHGSSGGALLNEYGEAIGITSAAYLYGESMYLAVPLDRIFDIDLGVKGISLKAVAQAEAAKGTEDPQ